MSFLAPRRLYVISNALWVIAGALIGFVSAGWIGSACGAALGGVFSPSIFGRVRLSSARKDVDTNSWMTLRRQFGFSLAISYTALIGMFCIVLYGNYTSNELVYTKCIISSSICEQSGNQYLIKSIHHFSRKIVDFFRPTPNGLRTIPVMNSYVSLYLFSLINAIVINMLCTIPYLICVVNNPYNKKAANSKKEYLKITALTVLMALAAYDHAYSVLSNLITYEHKDLSFIAKKIYSSYGRIGVQIIFTTQFLCIWSACLLMLIYQLFTKNTK